jgi:hypothetical protein
MQPQYVQEVDVLIAVVKWLLSEGWLIEHLSIPRGQGIDSIADVKKVRAELAGLNVEDGSVRYASKGEDIRATKGGTLWKIECKGLGTEVRTPTVRNNFDRALASTVSYYDKPKGLRLGLALPEEYLKHVEGRLPRALRTALNLWVFLYVKSENMVYTFAPDDTLSD